MSKTANLVVAYILHDDVWYLDASIRSFSPAGPVFAFVSRVPWHDEPGDWQHAAEVARAAGAEVIEGEWTSELAHRQAVKAALLKRCSAHALIPDGDEIIEPGLLQTLCTLAEQKLADRVYVHWDTYWKSTEYVIRPREQFTPCILVDLSVAEPVGCRDFEGGRPLILSPEHGLIHHLSYCGPDERIQRKITTWGHRDQVVPGWFENVWLAWDENKLLRNLHTTHPPAYGFAERIHVPEILRGVESQRRRDAEGAEDKERPGDEWTSTKANAGHGRFDSPAGRLARSAREPGTSVPGPRAQVAAASVVIPVHGGADDLRRCLESLAKCSDLLHEVIVVDNASPDTAADVAEEFANTALRSPSPGFPPAAPLQACGREPATGQGRGQGRGATLRVLRNPTNLGFAAACNQGLAASGGDVVLFLNSDTVVPRAGLVRLLEALQQGGTIAAAGPYTNFAGHGQQIAPTYTSLETLDLFAEDFAARDVEDVETDMLVGFCLVVKRSPLDEVGGFDERFGIGTFEDNDLCYRLRRAGYRLVVAARSYVHHAGSRTLQRDGIDVRALLARNERLYRAKWRDDLDSGFASHLSGLPPASASPLPFLGEGTGVRASRIAFDPARHPDLRRKRVRELARRADISLCMIVKDEERVLGDALASAAPFFRETIVVDTGSTDRTVEIAEAAGARVFHFPWTDSFAEARNESLRHARGRWVFWMDADDTLPQFGPESGEALIEAALNAPPDVCAFVVPVQFVESAGQEVPFSPEGPRGGASVPPPGEPASAFGTGRVLGPPPVRGPRGGGQVGGEGGSAGTRVDHVKLFRNLPGLAFEGRIHEQILPSVRRAMPHGQIVRCGAVVYHTGYDTSEEGQKKKRERDYKLLALDLEERPDHPFVLFNLGMTDHYCQEHEKAVEWFDRCLAHSQPDESHLRKAYALKAASQAALDRVDDALETLAAGLAAVGDDVELHFQTARLETQAGRLEGARERYMKALKCNPGAHFSSVDVGLLGFKTWHNLAGVCQALGRYAEARDWWLKAIQGAPGFLPSAFELFNAALAAGDLTSAQRALDHVRAVDGPGESWAEMGARFAETVAAAGDGGRNAEQFLRYAVTNMPDAAGPRLVLARRLLNAGREAEAEPLLRWLSDAGLAEAAFFLGVLATRRGDLSGALEWTDRALVLNPGHEQTREQADRLRAAAGGV